MDECKTLLESALQATGLRDNPTQGIPQAKQDDPVASALLKQQAGLEQDKKRHANEVNAFRQRAAAHQRKVQTLKDSQPKKQFVINKFGKGWKDSNKGYSKGQTQDHSKKQHKGHSKGKGKNKGQWTKRW